MKYQHHPITGLDLGVTISLVLDNVTRARGSLYERYLYADLRVNASLSDDHFR